MMKEHETPMSGNSCSTFSIATLLVITTIIAIHCAFPILMQAISLTLFLGFILAVVLVPSAVVAIFLSPSKGAQLDVARNPFYKWLFRSYLAILALVYVYGVVMSIYFQRTQEELFEI